MKILIVDDDESFVTMLKEALEAKGHSVLGHFDPVAGAAALSGFRPDLLLLDVDMPGGGGGAVYARVRENPATGNIPVIVVTGTTPPALVWERLRASPHPRSYLHRKPIDLVELMNWVDRFAAGSR